MGVTPLSTWPRVDHPASRLFLPTYSPYSDSLSLRLRLCALTLLRRITRRLIKQKARDQAFPCGHSPFAACRCTVSGSISLPSLGFFSPFPHGTGSLSVRSLYLALRNGLRRFRQSFTCSALLRYRLRVWMIFAYTAFTLYGPTFQRGSANHQIGNSTVAGPTTPAAPKWVPRQNQITVLKFTHASKQFLSLPAREPYLS